MIYLVWHYDYEQSFIIAVCDSKELAESHLAAAKEQAPEFDRPNYGIEEYVLNPPVAEPASREPKAGGSVHLSDAHFMWVKEMIGCGRHDEIYQARSEARYSGIEAIVGKRGYIIAANCNRRI